ncbi:hypothetical protein [Aequorivita marina]|uniref:hypothetical protein n=1 Tax=Aequorivita marina TaxID=3073654 RepID=UPI0028741AD0|nr:hypothetical protein [Aequorivita sp. S2608]MDS1298038.1 hypothetical protein [Aequorivita sp. S2608]
MKQFVKYIFGLVLILIASMYVLDFIYNSTYEKGAYRNKVMWMHDIQDEFLDYVVFGSSRGNNYVIPNLILDKTGQKGLNLAIQASGPLEIELAVKEYLKNNTAKRFFIQVDHWYNKENPDKTGQLSWLPFIVDDDVYEVFKPYGKEYIFYRYVPFYRYQMFDSRIGYRNVILSQLNKGLEYSSSRGYTQAIGELKKDKPYKFSLKDKPNLHFININEICKENDIEVVYFTAPIYRPEGSFDVLVKHLPNYHDLSNTIQDKNLFSNQIHVNKKGAKVFTNMLVDLFFESPSNRKKQ